MRSVEFSRSAIKSLQRIQAETRKLILAKIRQYAADPSSLANDLRALSGEFAGCVRMRVDDYRIIMTDDGTVVLVEHVGHRKDICRSGSGMNVQEIVTPTGEILVVLPKQAFLRLVKAAEDAADIEAVRAYRQKLAGGREDAVPSEYVERLLAGENRILVWREFRGMTVSALAEAAGLSQPYVTQIENGSRTGTKKTLAALANALRVELDDIA